MKRNYLIAFTAAFGLAALAVYGQNTAPAPTGEAAIKQTLAAYGLAYNKKDAAALAQFWAPNAEYLSDTGVATQGRDAIAGLFRKLWSEHPGTSLTVKSSSIKFIKPDVAVQDGVAEIKTAGGIIENSPYTAIWIQQDGKWLLSRVRDLPNTDENGDDAMPAALRDLDWLVGDWIFEDAGTKVEMHARWFKNRSFLTIDQTVTKNGEEVLSLMQMIGWDANDETLRSWMFDSRGGFGEGLWTRTGNEWTVDASGTLADGRTGSAQNHWKFLGEDRIEWASTNRQVDGRPAADMKVQYVRKAKR